MMFTLFMVTSILLVFFCWKSAKGFLVDWERIIDGNSGSGRAKDYLEDTEKMASVVYLALKLKHFRVEDLEAIREVVRSCIHSRPRDKD
ncbi:hypothetical protein Tco_0774141 [Tanacetum coccineum]|uniref:Uncharacterized protein n=1 Tax=Tanacetum coccineum TaxID=301880 RepID=A0ABQ4ZNK9_9ASTR